MKSAVIACLCCLLLLCAQGHPANRSSKCKCSKDYISKINPRFIKSEPVIHQPSIFCPRKEIIITTTTNTEKCVDPQSALGQFIQKNKDRLDRKAAVSATTASAQTTTWSSATLHSTSKL